MKQFFNTMPMSFELSLDDVSSLEVGDYGINETEGNSSMDSGPFTCDGAAGEDAGLRLFHTVLLPLLYGTVLLLGLLGNGLLLAVLLRRRRGLRVTEIYLLHLALADLLLLLTLPFAMAHAGLGWLFGGFLCRAVGVAHRLNFLCSSLLLACIGFDRYLAIVHAVRSLQGRRLRTVHLTCACVWLLCLALSLPSAAFLSVEPARPNASRQACAFLSHGLHANNWLLTSRLLTHLLCFFLPLAVMLYCYSAVVATLRHSQRGLEKQGAIRLALLITLVFCLCWLPYNVSVLLETLGALGVLEQGCAGRRRLSQATGVTESLGYAHCCLNPLLYAFLGVRFRQDLRRLLAGWGCPLGGCSCQDPPARGRERASRMSISEGGPTTSSSLI